MSCLPCFGKDDDDGDDQPNATTTGNPPPAKAKPLVTPEEAATLTKAKAFNFRELAAATKNFKEECLIGEGALGRVFKGQIPDTDQVIAVKRLDRNVMQGNKEFIDEVLLLSLFEHPNLVSLIGYCGDGEQRFLVYEFMEMGSLENHLFGDDPEKKVLDWFTRMRIASGAANGLEYLHDTANPPMIYRDLKPSNILLDEILQPKLSDYGLAKLGAGEGDDDTNPSSRVMATYGYSAPEYSSRGELTLKSDIYSFGVILLELIAGRRAIDTSKPNDEQNLVTWAQPIFREPKRFPELADPRLNKEFPVRGLNQAVGICAMCLQEESAVRPLVADVVAALSFLAVPLPNDVLASSQEPAPEPKAFTPPPEQKMEYDEEVSTKQDDKGGSSEHDEEDESSEESEDKGRDAESSHNSDRNSPEEESEDSDSGDADQSDQDDDSDNSKNKDTSSSDESDQDDDSDDPKNKDTGSTDESSEDDDSDDSKNKDTGDANKSDSDGPKNKDTGDADKSDQDDDSDDSKNTDTSDADESDQDDDSDDSKNKDIGAKMLDSKSKKHGGSPKSRSKQRKAVVTFKEPNMAEDDRRHTSSSSSESDSESDDESEGEDGERKSSNNKSEKQKGKSVDMGVGHQDGEG